MAKWYAIPKTMAMTEREYDANIRGMNLVFGAVLGFVLADAGGLPAYDFGIVLLLSASVVVTILYMAHSEYKLFYAGTAIVGIAILPRILADPLGIPPIPQLQPTLAVWTAMVLLVEIMPREKAAGEAKEKDQ